MPICELMLPKYPLCGSLGLAGLNCELRLGLPARISLCVRFHGHTPPPAVKISGQKLGLTLISHGSRFSVAAAFTNTESKLCITLSSLPTLSAFTRKLLRTVLFSFAALNFNFRG